MSTCLRCGGTGLLISGEVCNCGVKPLYEFPVCLNVPLQYQGLQFRKELLDKSLDSSYGWFMESLMEECLKSRIKKNYIICSPPNSGKTIWAYTLYGRLFAQGQTMPDLIDLMQARSVFLEYYNIDRELLDSLSTAPIAVIRLPWDLPQRFPETISTIVERRVRAGGATIFLFNGSRFDLSAKDTFKKLKSLEGDGSFNSICIKSWGGSESD